ncbi:MAG: flagellar basal body P-ring formation protein FlgA [Candidatus Tectomicrobia bacterium]|nr:flagellar basal body P-ring formation protein FlgA [Candidatus Tectomicrobia bacterium]
MHALELHATAGKEPRRLRLGALIALAAFLGLALLPAPASAGEVAGAPSPAPPPPLRAAIAPPSAPQAAPTAAAKITVNAAAIVMGDQVRLGDVAQIEAGTPARAERWQSLVLGQAPLPGQTRRFDGRQVEARLRGAGFPLDSTSLEVPEHIEVLRAYTTIEQNDLEQAVRDFLRRTIPWAPEQVEIGPISAPTPILLPDGEVELRIAASGLEDFRGPTTLTVATLVDGVAVKRFNVNLAITVRAKVVRLLRPLQRGEIVGAEMLRVEQADLAALPNGVFNDPQEVIGQQAKRPLSSFVILRRDMLEVPPLVRRGDLVTLLAQKPGLTVRTRGKVLGDARRGEQVRTVNLSSQREVIGKVLDAKTVVVEF